MGGSLEYNEVKAILQKPIYKNITNFVETGTYKGDTSLMASKYFANVYTMEINEDLYKESKLKAENQNINNIHFYLGDSTELLQVITPKLLDDGAVFFIDAHISGSDSSYNGKQLVPLYEELSIILTHILPPSIFIIDDVRLFNKFDDWKNITTEGVLEIFKSFGYSIKSAYTKNDRLFILTK